MQQAGLISDLQGALEEAQLLLAENVRGGAPVQCV